MRQKGFIPILIIILIAVIGVVGSYYLGKSGNIRNMSNQTPNETIDTASSSTPTPISTQIPSDWTLETSTRCNVNLPLPPKKEPYYVTSGGIGVNDKDAYWHYYEEATSSQQLFDRGFAQVIHTQDDAASGYVGGSVDVYCAPNATGYTTVSLATKLSQMYPPRPTSSENVKDLGIITIKFKDDITMWGNKVKVANFTGGMYGDENYYIFATPSHIYMVRKTTMSQLDSVRDTTQQILENLKFIN